MSRGKVRHQQPLLFIAQPKLDLPKAEMQQAYRTAKGKRKEVVTEEVKAEEEKPASRGEKSQSTDNKAAPTNKKANFKDLSTVEKVEYFLNLPAQIPKMKCEIVTSEGSLIGIISGREGDSIEFKSIRRPFKREVKLEDIRDIKMLGF